MLGRIGSLAALSAASVAANCYIAQKRMEQREEAAKHRAEKTVADVTPGDAPATPKSGAGVASASDKPSTFDPISRYYT